MRSDKTNHYVSHSKTLAIMLADNYRGTWSIVGEYSGLKVGDNWVHLMHRTHSSRDLLLERDVFIHQGTHIQIGRDRYEIGD